MGDTQGEVTQDVTDTARESTQKLSVAACLSEEAETIPFAEEDIDEAAGELSGNLDSSHTSIYDSNQFEDGMEGKIGMTTVRYRLKTIDLQSQQERMQERETQLLIQINMMI